MFAEYQAEHSNMPCSKHASSTGCAHQAWRVYVRTIALTSMSGSILSLRFS